MATQPTPPLIYPPSNKGLKACLEPLGSSSIIKSACSEQGTLGTGWLTSHHWCFFPLKIMWGCLNCCVKCNQTNSKVALSNFYWLIFENHTPPKKTSTIADLKTGPFHEVRTFRHTHFTIQNQLAQHPDPADCTCWAMAFVFWGRIIVGKDDDYPIIHRV